MTYKLWLYHPWLWIAVTLMSFGFCAWLPPRLSNPVLRRWVTYCVLVPLSLLMILYVYPVGIEFCRRLAVRL